MDLLQRSILIVFSAMHVCASMAVLGHMSQSFANTWMGTGCFPAVNRGEIVNDKLA